MTVTEGGIFDGAFRNDGRFINQGMLSFSDGIEYSCTGTFDNEDGEVFLFTPLMGITGRVHRRRYLTDSEVNFEANVCTNLNSYVSSTF